MSEFTLNNQAVHSAYEQLLSHGIYERVNNIPRLRRFMESHVFAVWDFMSLAKRLQRELTCVDLPWFPPSDSSSAKFINEIILVEETDSGPAQAPASHLELYLQAMREIGADTQQFEEFSGYARAGMPVVRALHECAVPDHVASFAKHTLDCAINGSLAEVAASFLYGREDLIPAMFRRLLAILPMENSTIRTFVYYLERHIEVDGDSHGPAARRLLEYVVDGNHEQWRIASHAALSAITARRRLWDGVLIDLDNIEEESSKKATVALGLV